MKIVVIDGTGLIGSKLVEKLRKDGHEPLAASPDTCVNTVRAEHRAAAQARHRRGVHRSDGTRASGRYESVGIGPWHDYPDLTAFTDLDVPSVDGFHKLIYKWTTIGDLQLQLVQPGAGRTPQGDFLAAHGEGVFHIGFSVDSVDEAEATAAALGLDVILRGRRSDGSGFSYFDTYPSAGVTLQVRRAPAS